MQSFCGWRVVLLAVVLAASGVRGQTNIWTGSGNASSDGNWSLGRAPIAGDDILLDGTSTGAMTWNAAATNTVASWTQTEAYTGTVTFQTVYGDSGFTNFTIAGNTVVEGGTWTHANNTTVETNRLHITVEGDFTLGAGATLLADGLGYNQEEGPGAGIRIGSPHQGTGAGHGGNGRANGPNSAWGYAYGDYAAPVHLGSGGGRQFGNAAKGGGAIRLRVGGNARIDGTLSANAGPRGTSGGGGAGGSVWIELTGGGTFDGGGILSARGTFEGGTTTAGGSGGRIAVTGFDTSAFSGEWRAFGGTQGGSAGTVYRANAAGTLRELIIDNNEQYTYAVTPFGQDVDTIDNLTALVVTNRGRFAIESGKTLTLGAAPILGATPDARGEIVYRGGTVDFLSSTSDVVIPEHFNLCVDTNLVLNSLVVPTNTALVHTENEWETVYGEGDIFRVDLELLESSGTALEVQPGGRVDATGYGYGRGRGPGAGGKVGTSAGGGAHGGDGGWDADVEGGTAYGSAMSPITLGSGGNDGTGSGAKGGGAVRIASHGGIVLNGPVTVNGGARGTNGGGGAGGSIWLAFPNGGTLAGGGDITANATPDGQRGGGAGGRIAITGYTDVSGHTGVIQAYGGATRRGAAGTIYRASYDGYERVLRVDNNGEFSAEITPGWAEGEGPALTSLVIANAGRFGVAPGQTLALDGVDLVGGGAVRGELVYRGGSIDIFSPTHAVTVPTNMIYGVDTNLTLYALTIPTNAVLTHSAQRTGTTHHFSAVVELLRADGVALDVQAGGMIDAIGRGFSYHTQSGTGPGAGEEGGNRAGGAGHGGRGGLHPHATEPREGGPAYGLIFAPQTVGSTGGRVHGSGANGGGVIEIDAAGDIVIDGDILAHAGPRGTSGSGGSGGSIWLRLAGGSLSGAGWIGADGTPDVASSHGGGGAGGRIAITGYDTMTAFSGTLAARGGPGQTYGAGGTIYREALADGAGQGVVLIDFDGRNTASYVPLPTSLVDATDDVEEATFSLAGGAWLHVQTNITAHALIMADASALELNGWKLTVRELTVDGEPFKVGTYEAADDERFYDAVGGGSIDVLGYPGTLFLLR